MSGLTFHIIEPRRRRDKKRGSQRIIFKVFSAFSVLSAVNKNMKKDNLFFSVFPNFRAFVVSFSDLFGLGRIIK